jgi:hypothetical protein
LANLAKGSHDLLTPPGLLGGSLLGGGGGPGLGNALVGVPQTRFITHTRYGTNLIVVKYSYTRRGALSWKIGIAKNKKAGIKLLYGRYY